MPVTILLVEDDTNLGKVLRDILSDKGYDIALCTDGPTGLATFKKQPIDICLLDVMLPRQDGYSLAKDIRKTNPQVPILFISAKGLVEDKLNGFEAGGDDYIVKPFSIEELIARIEVFLKRTPPRITGSVPLGEYQFDRDNLLLKHDKGDLILTVKEAHVLSKLIESKGRILRREEILLDVWGNDDYFLGRSMDVFISKLRKYLKHDKTLKIVNYRGAGFKLEGLDLPYEH